MLALALECLDAERSATRACGAWLLGHVPRLQDLGHRIAKLLADPDEMVRMTGGPVAVIDCFGILDDDTIEKYFELGCEVKGLGRGHINRIKDKVRKRKLAAKTS